MRKRIRREYKKIPLQQRMWNYMRRNPNFRVGDISLVLDVKRTTLARYISALHRAQYLKKVSPRSVRFEETEYTLLRNTGIIAPTYSGHDMMLFDYNSGEEVSIAPKKEKQ